MRALFDDVKRQASHVACGAFAQVREGVTALPVVTLSHEMRRGAGEAKLDDTRRIDKILELPTPAISGTQGVPKYWAPRTTN